VNLTQKTVLADLITQGGDYFAYRVIPSSKTSPLLLKSTIKKIIYIQYIFLGITLIEFKNSSLYYVNLRTVFAVIESYILSLNL